MCHTLCRQVRLAHGFFEQPGADQPQVHPDHVHLAERQLLAATAHLRPRRRPAAQARATRQPRLTMESPPAPELSMIVHVDLTNVRTPAATSTLYSTSPRIPRRTPRPISGRSWRLAYSRSS